MTSFPFGYPAPTALYLCLYVVTLAVHGAFAGYVLGGAAYVAGSAALGRRADPIAAVFRDWLPFALGVAITAGVAPLLFLQILYQDSFYTANLLLFHRWMAMVPVLIAGFYLLYLAKTQRAATWPAAVRAGIALAAFACFAFTAYTWVENHALALDRSTWVGFYAEARVTHASRATTLRFAMWLAAAAPVAAVGVALQVGSGPGTATSLRRLAALALVGLAAALGFGAAYAAVSDGAGDILSASAARPWLVVVGLGVACQVGGWVGGLVAPRRTRAGVAVAAFGVVLAALGTLALREIARLASMSIDILAPRHAAAASADGLALFVVFLVVNAGVITWCLRLARRGRAS